MITAEEFIKKHLGKTYIDKWNEEVMIVGISEDDIIIGRYNDSGWNIINSCDEIKIFSPIIESYTYLFEDKLEDIDKLLSNYIINDEAIDVTFAKQNLGKNVIIHSRNLTGMIIGHDKLDIIIGFTKDNGWKILSDSDKLLIHSPIIKSYWYTTQSNISIIE